MPSRKAITACEAAPRVTVSSGKIAAPAVSTRGDCCVPALAVPLMSITRAAAPGPERGCGFARSSALQSSSHRRASNSVPRTPMIAVLVWKRTAVGSRFAMSPVTARMPPLTSPITMERGAVSEYSFTRKIVSGRSVMRVWSLNSISALLCSATLIVSFWSTPSPMPRMRGFCPARSSIAVPCTARTVAICAIAAYDIVSTQNATSQ